MLNLFQNRIDFIIAGTQKGGTTSLDAYLRQHPQIRMGKKKEVHFFDKRKPTGWNALDHAVYNANFKWPRATPDMKVGEATPIYMWWHGAPERIWTYNPDIKLIILLRDPVERAWSHFKMDTRLGRDGAAFEDAIRDETNRARRSLPKQDRERSLIARGFYAPQIRELFRLFPRKNLYFQKSEVFSQSPQQVLDEVCDFLDCKRHVFDTQPRLNADPTGQSMPDTARAFLEDQFYHDAQDVRRLLNWSKDHWSV